MRLLAAASIIAPILLRALEPTAGAAQSVTCNGGPCVSSNVPMYAVATLPPCVAGQPSFADVSDLPGGEGMVLCVSGSWRPISDGTPVISTSTGVTPVPALGSHVLILNPSGGAFALGAGINLLNAYPTEMVYVKTPSTLGGLVTSLGVNVNNTPVSGVSLVAGQTSILVVNSDLSVTKVQ